MSARFLTHRINSAPLSEHYALTLLSEHRAEPSRLKYLWGASARHPKGAAPPVPAEAPPSLSCTMTVGIKDVQALPGAEGVRAVTWAS